MFYLLQSPGDLCPLSEYCLIEAAYDRSVDVVLDLRRGSGSALLSDRNVQRALGLSYERIPREWESIRAQPRLVARLLESLASSWPSVLPFRMLIVYEGKDRWWVEAACERCQAGDLNIRVDEVDWGGGPGEVPCLQDRCPLLRQGDHHSGDLGGGSEDEGGRGGDFLLASRFPITLRSTAPRTVHRS
ncbi:MAG TPA: hypothetical protein ENK56_10050 [Chloroflexi bacterium]|nr:hypothetical protein [Chloroflexota bacterium]